MTPVDHDIRAKILRSWNTGERLSWPSFREDPGTHKAFKAAWETVRGELILELGEARILDIVDFGHASGLSAIYRRGGGALKVRPR